MTSQLDAARAAERYADDFVGDDPNMKNATVISEDDTFRSLAVSLQQLGFVGGSTPGVYDGGTYGDGVGDYVAGQTDCARDAVLRAMDSRAAEVLDAAYAFRDAPEVDA